MMKILVQSKINMRKILKFGIDPKKHGENIKLAICSQIYTRAEPSGKKKMANKSISVPTTLCKQTYLLLTVERP